MKNLSVTQTFAMALIIFTTVIIISCLFFSYLHEAGIIKPELAHF